MIMNVIAGMRTQYEVVSDKEQIFVCLFNSIMNPSLTFGIDGGDFHSVCFDDPICSHARDRE